MGRVMVTKPFNKLLKLIPVTPTIARITAAILDFDMAGISVSTSACRALKVWDVSPSSVSPLMDFRKVV
jgi:hypothetical protein